MRILVVEDEKRLAQNLQELLRREGYTVDVSNDGVSGLDNALSGIYDLLVLDVMLPGLDGFALLRRSNGESGGDDRIHRGDLVLDPGTFQVTCGQRSARLSRKEYDLLEMLMRNGGQILSKEQLLLKAWGYESNAEDNNVEVYISFLRRKLELVRSNMRIRTVRLVGYCLEEKE